MLLSNNRYLMPDRLCVMGRNKTYSQVTLKSGVTAQARGKFRIINDANTSSIHRLTPSEVHLLCLPSRETFRSNSGAIVRLLKNLSEFIYIALPSAAGTWLTRCWYRSSIVSKQRWHRPPFQTHIPKNPRHINIVGLLRKTALPNSCASYSSSPFLSTPKPVSHLPFHLSLIIFLSLAALVFLLST